MITLIERLAHDESASTAIEYALIAGSIAVAIVSLVQGVGGNVVKFFAGVESGFN